MSTHTQAAEATLTDFLPLNGTDHIEFYVGNAKQAAYFYQVWQQLAPEALVDTVLQNQELWGQDLTALPGFAATVKKHLAVIEQDGVLKAIRDLEVKQLSA